ncbi:conserved hypothetical protein [Bradyrhizobium sp. STM 3843]|uniref:hypothetical protein n=1 Tax=Bradyrhizobium sp. STM 3843 TaxID=551947 RepID=UPI00024035FB|nr:hypothetical protein [Bradyrhizobium sp. STM 3843]CCE11418.1 conserved hypothetical protein [Bradyrhizobium sp. STM 3843]
MGRYLDILKRAGEELGIGDQSDKSDRWDRNAAPVPRRADFGRFGRFGRTSRSLDGAFAALERRCPERVELDRWRQAVADSRRFLGRWGDQAAALGWTASDLFGLHQVPEDPAPTYRRLSRDDETGLVWLLQGRHVVALTKETAAIEQRTGVLTIYRKKCKPALGPLGDSVDNLK